MKKETYDKMPWLIWVIASLFCKHDYKFVRNIYGDEVMFVTDGNRSWWQCEKCGKLQSRPSLYADKDYLVGREGYLPLKEDEKSKLLKRR